MGPLPWDVLVTREVAGAGPGDATVSAAELLGVLARRRRHAAGPPGRGLALAAAAGAAARRWRRSPASELSRLATAAAGTLREVTAGGLAGRAVGQRAVRDALLDHVALVVTPPERRPGRGVAAARAGGRPDGFSRYRPTWTVRRRSVCVAGRWVGLSAPYGVAWLQPVKELTVMPIA